MSLDQVLAGAYRSVMERCPPLVAPPLPNVADTELRRILAMAKLAQFDPMDYQVLVWAGMSERADGLRYRWPQAGLSVPRQSGKTLAMMVYSLERLLLRRQQVAWIGQEMSTTLDVWRKKGWPLVTASKLDERHGLRWRASTIRPGIEWPGATPRLGLGSNATKRGGHGATLDLAVLDEAWTATDDVETALQPTLITRFPEGAQMVLVSTHGDSESHWWNGYVDLGRAAFGSGVWGGFGWWEWGASPDDDPGDPAVWARAIPSFGLTIFEEDLRVVYDRHAETGSLDVFRRSYLNVRLDYSVSSAVWSTSAWNAVEVPHHQPQPELEGGIWLGLDMTPERDRSSLVACDRSGRAELVRAANGSDWVVPTVSEIVAANTDVAGVAYAANGPASTVGDDLAALPGVEVWAAQSGDYGRACGRLSDAVIDEKLVVVSSGGVFDMARAGLIKRAAAGGMYTWARIDDTVDISPVVALTLAYEAAVTGRQAKPKAWAVDWDAFDDDDDYLDI